jgi:hypothetical protein
MKTDNTQCHQPWNKEKLVGQKAPPRLRDIWAIQVRLQIGEKTWDLALFDLAIDTKLRDKAKGNSHRVHQVRVVRSRFTRLGRGWVSVFQYF